MDGSVLFLSGAGGSVVRRLFREALRGADCFAVAGEISRLLAALEGSRLLW